MASDDQHRDAAGDEHAMGKKPESRVRDDRAKELAKREEHRKTEQVKADTQRKAESAKAEERRTAESRRQEEKKRAEHRQESLRKEAERRIEDGKAAVEKERARRQFSRAAEDRNEDRGSHRRAGQEPCARRGYPAARSRQRSPNASSVRKRNSRRSIAGRRTTCVALHHDEMHSFKENEDTAIAIHRRQSSEHR